MVEPPLPEITGLAEARLLFGPGESLFRRLLDNLPAGAYLCDPEGLITYFNQRAVELWGREPKLYNPQDRFCGSFKLFLPDGTPIIHEHCWMALAIRNQRAYNGEEIIIERPDGSRITALAHASPVHDDNGALLGAMNVLVDISEQKRAAQVLLQSKEELERRVAERTAALAAGAAALKREVEERKRAQARLQQLNRRIMQAEEDERKMISSELHESVGQMVTALLIELSVLRNSASVVDKKLLEAINSLNELTTHIHDDVRFVSHLLRPPALEVIGLEAALYTLCQEMTRYTGKGIIVYHSVGLPSLPEQQTLALYRFVQEALNNAVHHAAAQTITVHLDKEDRLVCVTVEDDGAGFVPPAEFPTNSSRGVGLARMREQLQMAGIDLEITSAPGAGSRLAASYAL